MHKCIKIVLTFLLFWALVWSSVLHAEPKLNLNPGFAPANMSKQQRQQRQNRERGERGGRAVSVSLDQAIKMAEQRYGGKALSAKRIQGQGPAVFKVKLLSKGGRVSAVYVDATTGDVFKTR